MPNYTKLFNSIVTSTIWTEDDKTRILWITMLAMCDQHGEVHASIPGLARIAGIDIQSAEAALQKFMSPDEYSRTPDNEGRRIAAIEGGWEILNHKKYRAMASKDDAKAATAARVKRHRDRLRNVAQSNADVTQRNAKVTHGRDIADTDTDADADIVLPNGKTKKRESRSDDLDPPIPFESFEFQSTWSLWEQHLKEKRKPISKTTKRLQFKKLKELGEQRAIAALERSITNGWQGIFEEKDSQSTTSRPMTFGARPPVSHYLYKDEERAEIPDA